MSVCEMIRKGLTLLYSSETWILQKRNERNMNAVEMQSFCRICGVSLAYRMLHNDEHRIAAQHDSAIEKLAQRTKKMTCNLKDTLRKIKDTSHDFGKSVYDNLNIGLKKIASIHSFNDEDIRQYERLVFMKKYPFLDIQKLEMKYSPTPSKDVRQSTNLYLIRNVQREPSICEPSDLLNVEITNRGLTGFAIPLHVPKQVIVENKSDINLKNSNSHEFPTQKTENILQSLKEDVKTYIENHN